MPDGLYERDVLAWSEQQATLLRRLARGERVNDLDWEHVAEEIEDVGLSELHAVHSFLTQILVHLMTLRGWPGSGARFHWRGEIVAFQTSARRRFVPSMRQRIDLPEIYGDTARQIGQLRRGNTPAIAPARLCPVTLDQLLTEPVEVLEAAFQASEPDG